MSQWTCTLHPHAYSWAGVCPWNDSCVSLSSPVVQSWGVCEVSPNSYSHFQPLCGLGFLCLPPLAAATVKHLTLFTRRAHVRTYAYVIHVHKKAGSAELVNLSMSWKQPRSWVQTKHGYCSKNIQYACALMGKWVAQDKSIREMPQGKAGNGPTLCITVFPHASVCVTHCWTKCDLSWSTSKSKGCFFFCSNPALLNHAMFACPPDPVALTWNCTVKNLSKNGGDPWKETWRTKQQMQQWRESKQKSWNNTSFTCNLYPDHLRIVVHNLRMWCEGVELERAPPSFSEPGACFALSTKLVSR